MIYSFREYKSDFSQNYSITVEEVSGLFAHCRRCGLCASRTQTVHYRIAPKRFSDLKDYSHIKVVFIGQCPGQSEDELGIPFVGPSGKMLESIFTEVNFQHPVFLINVTACKPESGNDNKKEEIIACSFRLWLLLQAIRPRLVVALGEVPCGIFWEDQKWQRYKIYEYKEEQVFLCGVHHPSFLIRSASEGNIHPIEKTVTFFRELNKYIFKISPFPKNTPWNFPGLSVPFTFLKGIV